MTIVAIDFGTSNTVVSLWEPDVQAPKTLHLGAMTRLFTSTQGETVPVVPSLVAIPAAQPMVVGEQARSRRLPLHMPERCFLGFKRALAADFQPPTRVVDGRKYDPEHIGHHFLAQLWQALLAQEIVPSQLILTVPVGAFERYRRFLHGWAQTLPVDDVQFVDEATAAALNYVQLGAKPIVLVIDFGGGTLDLSLVRLQPHSEGTMTAPAEVLAKADAYLGGSDIDEWIVTDYLQQQGDREALGAIAQAQLLEIAEQLKIRLSQANDATESWLDESRFTAYEIHLSRDHLTHLLETNGLLAQLRDRLDEVLQTAYRQGVKKADIAEVILVGGTSLIPAVQELVIAYFGRDRVRVDRPFTAISHGALALTHLPAVQDYLQHSYAIRLWEPNTRDYAYLTLFPKGCHYPCLRPEPLTLQVACDGQTEIRLDIGEIAETPQTEVTYDALGRMTSRQRSQQAHYHALQNPDHPVCVAHLQPHGTAGKDRILIDFEVNEQRMLLATVRDLLTQQILVERSAIAQLK